MSTKENILSTAERLIAEQGFAATSLRQIIAEADVNLAAVHYHFGSKQELLDEVIAPKAALVNQQRSLLLDRYEKEAAPRSPSVEKILTAFFEPVIDMAAQNPQFVKLMGRVFAEGMMPSVVGKHFQATVARFIMALRRAFPELPEAELFSRLQFMIGAMAHAITGMDPLAAPVLPKDGNRDFAAMIRRLIVFLSAGFRAPATKEVKK